MKALFLLVLIYNLQNVRPFGGSDDESSILMKYPKKSNPIYKHHQKLINSGQVHKKEFQENYKPRSLQRLGLGMKEPLYSAFPPKVGMSQVHSAPDSPLFPLDFDFEHKHRVKKTSYNRYKRSVSNNTNDDHSSQVTVGQPKESQIKTEEKEKPKENKNVENKAKAVKPKESDLSNHKPKKTENPKDSKQKENTPKEAVKHKEKKTKDTGKPTASKHTEKTPKQTIKPKLNKLRQKRPKGSVSPKDSKLREKRPRTAVVHKENKLRENPKSAVKPKDNKRGQSKIRENKPKSNRSAVKTKRDSLRSKKNLRENKQISNKTALKTKRSTVRHKSVARNRNKNSKVRSRRDLIPKRGVQSKKGKKNKSRQQSRGSKLRNRQNNKTVGKIGKKHLARTGKKPVQSRLRSKDNKTDKSGKASRRLIASRDVSPEDYPYMVSIQKDNEHWCSGAVLNRRLIISTANCFWKSHKVSRLKARIGSRNVDSGGQLTRIQEVMKHPKWNIRGPPDNDVALAVLDRNLKFSHAVHAVDLPNRAMLPPFDDAWVTSFGADRRDGVYMQHHGMTLQMYHARLVDPQKCNNITQRFGVPVSENFICLSQSGRRSPCTRDTGAPAVSDGVLWGLASWGIRRLCGTERFPAMFSYMGSGSNLDFIINATSYLMVDERENPMLDRLPRIPGLNGQAEEDDVAIPH